MRSNRQPLVQLCGKLLRERKVCTSDILAFASSHDQPRSGPNNSERESTSGRSTNYGSGRLIQVFRDIGRIFSLLFLLSHPLPVGHPLRGSVQKRERNMVSSQAKNGFNCVSCGTHRGGPSGGCVIRKTRTPPEGVGRGLGNDPIGAACTFKMRPTTAPSASTSKSSSLHSPDPREAEARRSNERQRVLFAGTHSW